jgi:hypothetical protein
LKWRRPVSLAAQLSILLAVVVAVAEPLFRRPQLVVFVLDNSASMNATDIQPSRLDRAKQWMQKEIERLAYPDEMAVILGGPSPRRVCGVTSRRTQLAAAVAKIRPSRGRTRVREAVDMARRIASGSRDGAILVLSDGCFPEASDLASAPDVRFVQIGAPGDNVAVTALAARRCLAHPRRCQILAEVTSYAAERVQCHLRFELEDRLVRSVPIEMEPAEHWQGVFEIDSPRGGRWVAGLDHPDVFPADNKATAWVRPVRVHRVIVSGQQSAFLEAALQANAMVELTDIETEGSQDALIRVFHREIPNELPKGPLLVIDPTGECDLWGVQGSVHPQTVTQQRKSSLLLQESLIGLGVGQTRSVVPKRAAESWQVLASNAEGQPLLCTIDRPEGRLWVLCCNLEESDLVERTIWPVLLADALDWLDPPQQARPPAESAKARVSRGGVLSEEGFGVDPGAAAESDLRAPAGIDEGMPSQPGRRWPPLWTYFAAFALIGMLAEWCLFQRRWIC